MQGGRPVFILKDINMTVAEGEFVSIMGPSGSGKSTLLNVIGMLEVPNEGTYNFMGNDVFKMKEKQRSELYKHHIGFVFQAYHLIDELTVYENIETPLLYKGVKSSERKSMVADILDRFGMVAKKDLFPTQLSGGQQQLVGIARAIIGQPTLLLAGAPPPPRSGGRQQLVGIARAIIGQPKLLLADEPTGNLHSDQARVIMELFKKLNDEGITIIQVTHSEVNAQYGNRIVNFMDGYLVESRPEQLA